MSIYLTMFIVKGKERPDNISSSQFIRPTVVHFYTKIIKQILLNHLSHFMLLISLQFGVKTTSNHQIILVKLAHFG